MNCLSCGFKNPMTVGYCQQCGARMDLTADEIQASLVHKKKGERRASAEEYSTHALVFGVVVLLIALTAFVMSGGAPEKAYVVPSVSSGVGYMELEESLTAELKPLLIPVEPGEDGR